jgi:hypothetical protein
MKDILDSQELRQGLIKNDSLVLLDYSMDPTAASFQELYVKTAALPPQR